MKKFKEFQEAYGRHDAYTRDYHSSISGMGKHQSAAYHADGGANDEGWDREHHHKPADHPHSVHINGKKWKTFGSHSHASNVARKIKGATVHREEVQIEEDNSHHDKAEEHLSKANDAEREGRMKDFHAHMADHHDSMSEWHDSKGRSASADKHAEKADYHHEKSLTVKEETEQLDELSSDLLQRYKDKAMKSSEDLFKHRNYKKSNDRLLAHMKATGKQLEKTTAAIRQALGKK